MTRRIDDHARETVDAIRLAIEGAANDATALAVIRELLDKGPPIDKKGTASVRRFLRAVNNTRGKWELAR